MMVNAALTRSRDGVVGDGTGPNFVLNPDEYTLGHGAINVSA
jgi:hypothetical protein